MLEWKDSENESVLEDYKHRAVISRRLARTKYRYYCTMYEKEPTSNYIFYEKFKYMERNSLDAMKRTVEQSAEFRKYFNKKEIEKHAVYKRESMRATTYAEKAYGGKEPYWTK